MAHGGFKQYHFGLLGDGRTNGAEQASSGLGDSVALCRKIICNAAACLMDADWEWDSDCVCYSDYINSTTAKTLEQWEIDSPDSGNTYTIHLYHDTDYKVMEVPLKYIKEDQSVTRLWLLYASEVTTTKNMVTYLDPLYSNNSWLRSGNFRGYASGLSILYWPAGASQPLKLIPMSGYPTGNSGSSYFPPLSYYNMANIPYTYQFICKNDFIAANFYTPSTYYSSGNTSRNYSSKIVFMGEIYDTLHDPLDTTFSARKYGAIGTIDNGTREYYTASSNSLCNSNGFSSGQFGDISSNLYIPALQWYDVNGTIQATYHDADYGGYGLFYYGSTLLRALNFQADAVNFSKITVGNIPGFKSTYEATSAKVSNSNYIKGTINEDYLIATDITFQSGSYISPKLAFQQTLENGKYIHLGTGICMGWDPANQLGFLDDYTNLMQEPTQVGGTPM